MAKVEFFSHGIGRMMKYFSGLVLAGGLACGFVRACQTPRPPQIDVNCDSRVCTIDVWGENFKRWPPQLGPETGCGARVVKAKVLSDYWARFELNIEEVGEACGLRVRLGDEKFTFPNKIPGPR